MRRAPNDEMPKKRSTRTPGKKASTSKKATSYRQVADRYGVRVDTVRKDWTSAKAGMPKLPATWLALGKWHSIYKKKANVNGHAAGDKEVVAARRASQIAEARIKEARADVEVHRARQVLESMVAVDDVERFLADYFTEFRRQALRISKEMKPGVPSNYRATFQKELDARINMLLRSMRNYALAITDLRTK